MLYEVITRNCRIDADTVLTEATLWDDVTVRANSRIEQAALCHRVRIGQGVQIEPGVVIADETTVGDEVHIRPNVKIWPRKVRNNFV